MVSSNHKVELYINGQLAELSDDLDITFERILRDVTKLTSTNTSYSYTFSLPKTKNNVKIFNFANVPSKLSKFSSVYNATLYNDSILLFEGFLKITEIDDEDFKCNMYENKLNTVETIFGESKMNEINWLVDFNGLETVNEVNADMSTKYFFPLVSYGLFQKVPSVSTNNADYYTSKRKVDETNRFYYNSYVPSLNLVEVMKRMCEAKGYTLEGSFLNDKLIQSIYLSNYIADDQSPLYNYGNPKLGEVTVQWDMHTINRRTQSSYATILGNDASTYYLINPPTEYSVGSDMNNFDSVNFINAFNVPKTNRADYGSVTVENEAKLYHNGWIEIPCDGYYQISLEAEFGLDSGQTALEGVTLYDNNGNAITNQTVNVSISNMPIELHLVRYNGQDGDAENNISHDIIYKGSFPNEAESVDFQPSESSGTTSTNSLSRAGISRPSTAAHRDNGNRSASGNNYRNNSSNYTYPWHYTSYNSSGMSTNIVCVDPYNNNSFICGLAASQWLRGAAVLKDGRSWSDDYNDIDYDSLYNCNGYYATSGGTSYVSTDWNKNTLQGSPTNEVRMNSTSSFIGRVNLIVRLNQGDLLSLYMITRHYEPSSERGLTVQYQVWSEGTLKVKAVAPTLYPREDIYWDMESQFDKQLNLGNFCNEEQKMSDFFNDVIKAFKLSFSQNGNSIRLDLDSNSEFLQSFIPIDDRVNNNEVTIKNIDFPKSLEVKYTIDTEEEGFYQSVPYDKLELNNWTEYGDYGSDKVDLISNSDGNDLSETLSFSYDWLTSFSIMDFYEAKNNGNINYIDFMIPTIGKNEWYIENYRYDEMAANDGRSMNQRMWFRTQPLTYRLPTDIADYKEATDDDWYYITIPTDKMTIDGTEYELSYKDKEGTLLSRYFNINYDGSTNEVEADVYINPMEYKTLSNGGNVIFDSDSYSVNRIRYSLDRQSTTKLTLMKMTR